MTAQWLGPWADESGRGMSITSSGAPRTAAGVAELAERAAVVLQAARPSDTSEQAAAALSLAGSLLRRALEDVERRAGVIVQLDPERDAAAGDEVDPVAVGEVHGEEAELEESASAVGGDQGVRLIVGDLELRVAVVQRGHDLSLARDSAGSVPPDVASSPSDGSASPAADRPVAGDATAQRGVA